MRWFEMTARGRRRLSGFAGIEASRGRAPISPWHMHAGERFADVAGPTFKANGCTLPPFNSTPGTELGLLSLIIFLFPYALLLSLSCARSVATGCAAGSLETLLPQCRTGRDQMCLATSYIALSRPDSSPRSPPPWSGRRRRGVRATSAQGVCGLVRGLP
jgi:hypothetical protein